MSTNGGAPVRHRPDDQFPAGSSRAPRVAASVALGLGVAGDEGVHHVPRAHLAARRRRRRARRSGRRRRCRWRGRRSEAHDLAPSATCRVEAMISSVVMPWPSFSPKVRLRDSGEEQVATRSPSPARPISVSGSAPSFIASRAVSASPRVISEAVVLSPKPEADRHPDAQRRRRSCRRRRARSRARRCCGRGGTPASGRGPAAAAATASSAHATTLAAGSRWAISRARLGPLTTRDPLGTGAGDLGDHLAHPLGGAELDALHQRHEHGVARACTAVHSPRFSRSFCEGTESTTNSAPASRLRGVGGRPHRWRAARCPGSTRCSRAAR